MRGFGELKLATDFVELIFRLRGGCLLSVAGFVPFDQGLDVWVLQARCHLSQVDFVGELMVRLNRTFLYLPHVY